MPSWQPDWSDVPFDHPAAHEYAAACRRTSSTLRQIADQRTHLASLAVVDWEGPKRVRFDGDIARWNTEASTVADQLLAVATRVEAASETARHLQAQREAGRVRWWAERQTEELAAEAAEAASG